MQGLEAFLNGGGGESHHRRNLTSKEVAMSLGLAFWVLMLLWLVLGLYIGYTGASHFVLGGNLLLFILLLLLGWKVFGPPLQG